MEVLFFLFGNKSSSAFRFLVVIIVFSILLLSSQVEATVYCTQDGCLCSTNLVAGTCSAGFGTPTPWCWLAGNSCLDSAGSTLGVLWGYCASCPWPTPAPTNPPTYTPTLPPTYAPTVHPTHIPTPLPTSQKPSRSPTTSTPTKSPTKAPTEAPTSQKPSKTPSKAPTTSVPSRNPTPPTTRKPSVSPSVSPSEAPTTTKPSHAPSTSKPTTSPTQAPVYLNLCNGSSLNTDSFLNYNNFYDTAAQNCVKQCQSTLLTGIASSIDACAGNCNSFDGYTTQCTICFGRFLACQATNCGECFLATSNYQGGICTTCTAQYCQKTLQDCTGFSAKMMLIPTTAPLSTGGSDPQSVSTAPVVGGAIGGMFAVFAAVLLVRREQSRRRVSNELQAAVEGKIFKPKDDELSDLGMVPFASQAGGAVAKNESENPIYFGEMSAAVAVAAAGGAAALASSAAGDEKVNVPLKSRFSFHGEIGTDELDVPAGAFLTGLKRNDLWWVAMDEQTQKVGLIPTSYCLEL